MSLQLYSRPSFERSLKNLSPEQLKIIGLILEALKVYYKTGCSLTEANNIVPHFFYKQLRKPYYEAGVDRSLRVILRQEGVRCVAVLAGNHNHIKQFLARV